MIVVDFSVSSSLRLRLCNTSAMLLLRPCNASFTFLQFLCMCSVPPCFVFFLTQSSFIQQSFFSLGAIVLVGAVSFTIVTHNDSVSTTLSRWNKEPPVPLVIGGMLLFVFLFWRKLMDSYK